MAGRRSPMSWQVGMTEGTFSGTAARVTGKSATRYDLIVAVVILVKAVQPPSLGCRTLAA
jgi:hypothetical protein